MRLPMNNGFCYNETFMTTSGWQDPGIRYVNVLVFGTCVGEYPIVIYIQNYNKMMAIFLLNIL